METDFSLRPPKIFGSIFWKSFANKFAKMGPKIFGGLNEKSGFIFKPEIWLCSSCKKNYGKILIVAQVTRPNVRRTMEKMRFEIWPF